MNLKKKMWRWNAAFIHILTHYMVYILHVTDNRYIRYFSPLMHICHLVITTYTRLNCIRFESNLQKYSIILVLLLFKFFLARFFQLSSMERMHISYIYISGTRWKNKSMQILPLPILKIEINLWFSREIEREKMMSAKIAFFSACNSFECITYSFECVMGKKPPYTNITEES